MTQTRTVPTYAQQILFWTSVAVLLCLTLWLLQDILLPFVLAWAIAYLLNPVVNKLGDMGLGRCSATIVILGAFTAVLSLFAIIVGPILYDEMSEIIKNMPRYMDQVESWLMPYIERAKLFIDQQSLTTNGGQKSLGQYASSLFSASGTVFGGLAAGGAAIGNFVSTLILTPVLAFFMMRDWPQMMSWLKSLIPKPYESEVLQILSDIDQKIAGFVRGQIMVALFLGILYALACTLAGLKYGFLIGFVAGLLNVVPMFGSVIGLVVGVAVAYLQSADLIYTAIIAAIFLGGQLLEGNVLTPKLVGESVGMHALWIFFSLMAGAALLGVTGMLIAIPLVASMGVLINFGLEKYKDSAFYVEGDPETIENKKPKSAKNESKKSSKTTVKKA